MLVIQTLTNANHVDYNLHPLGHWDCCGTVLSRWVRDLDNRIFVCLADHDMTSR